MQDDCETAVHGQVPKGNDHTTNLQGEETPLLNGGSVDVSDTSSSQGLNHAWIAMLVTTPIFMGYSTLLSFQSKIKNRMGITDQSSHDSYTFGVAVGFIFLGNLCFRLLHNVVFSMLRPRHRVMVSYTCVAASISLIATMIFAVGSSAMWVIFVSYLLAGVGIGCFEANILSCMTPLGHNVKKWAVLGMPVGYNGTSILGFLVFYMVAEWIPDKHIDAQCGVFFAAAGCNVVGLLMFATLIPDVRYEASEDTLLTWIKDLRKFKEWIPLMWQPCLALFVDMFAVIMLSSIQQYIFNLDEVPLWPGSHKSVGKNLLLLLLNAFGLIGDAAGRVFAYEFRKGKVPRSPLIFLPLCILALGLGLSKVMLLAPVSQLFALFANGCIYATTTKYVDSYVPRAFNLIALSVWLFSGDLGSFIAANAVTPVLSNVGIVATAAPPPSPSPQ